MCLGVPGQVTEVVDASQYLVKVDVAGVRRTVNARCVLEAGQPVDACIGDWVLVHVGFAMSRIDAEEAQKTLELLTEMGELQQELQSMRQPANREGQA